ncbi:MAG: hypothetical protein KAR06_02695 [Deltaproteobacteria bacterium]|nr:hypothetical protein [Deltaproteobacteria bacterium]
MAEEEKTPCDVDDVVCQIEVLAHLKGLQKGLGNNQFREQFPELVGLDERIRAKVEEQDKVVQKALEDCGSTSEATVPETPAPEELSPESDEEL